MDKKSTWTFFTNHAHVMVALNEDPKLTLREVALTVGITERAVQRIVAELAESGILDIEKKGRKNIYQVNTEQPLRHELEAHRSIGEILELLKK